MKEKIQDPLERAERQHQTPIRLSPERKAAIEVLIARGEVRSIQHALVLEAARYIKLPD